MIYSDEFMEALPTDMVEAGKLMCELYFENRKVVNDNHIEDMYYNELLDSYIAIEEFTNVNMPNKIDSFQFTKNRTTNTIFINNYFSKIYEYLNTQEEEYRMESARNRYKTLFDNSFSYRFTEGDLKRIQTLINTLRESINESNLFEDNHKTRLLGRLEKLQKELHKKMSNIDVMWGFIGDAGVVLGKFGENAKPFVDIIKEITQIAWRTQAAAEELPSGSSIPMLNE